VNTRRAKTLSDLLLELRLLDPSILDRAKDAARHQKKRLLTVLVESGVIDEKRLVLTLSNALGIESIDLSAMQVHKNTLARLPAKIAHTHGALPVAAKRANGEEYLYVALANPLDYRGAQEIRAVTGCALSVLMAYPTQLDRAILKYYPSNSEPAKSKIPSAPPVIGKPLPSSALPVGIDEFQSDLFTHTSDPDISDIVITPASSGGSDSSTNERPQRPAENQVPQQFLNIDLPDNLGQAWDDGKTLDVDLDEVSSDQFRPVSSGTNDRQLTPTATPEQPSIETNRASATPYDLAAALELPLKMTDSASPFDGIAPVNLPTGLERTGIIPIGDFDADEFAPPPLEEEQQKTSGGMIGLTDIPESATQVAFRSSDSQSTTDQGDNSPSSKKSSVPPEQFDSVELEEIQPNFVVEQPESELEATPASNQKVPLKIESVDTKSDRPDHQPDLSTEGGKANTAENSDALRLICDLRNGETLTSSDRIQVFLAITRFMLDQGIVSEEQLAHYLSVIDAS